MIQKKLNKKQHPLEKRIKRDGNKRKEEDEFFTVYPSLRFAFLKPHTYLTFPQSKREKQNSQTTTIHDNVTLLFFVALLKAQKLEKRGTILHFQGKLQSN